MTLTNDTHPDFQGWPEAAKADMDASVEHLRMVLPIIGFDLFRKATVTAPSRGAAPAGSTAEAVFTFSTAGASATGKELDEGFVVLAGSTARKGQTGTFAAGHAALRAKLLAEGGLVDDPSSPVFRSIADVAFSSPQRCRLYRRSQRQRPARVEARRLWAKLQ